MASKADRDQVARFLSKMYMEAIAQQTNEQSAFDGISADIMHLIYSRTEDIEKGVSYSNTMLAKFARTTVKRARNRIRHLARYGIVKTFSPWRNDGSGLREQSVIFINPAVDACFSVKNIAKHENALIKKLCRTGIQRLDEDVDCQGFSSTVALGMKEIAREESKGETVLLEIAKNQEDEKAEKARLNWEWRQRGEQFVLGCSEIWIKRNAVDGMGTAIPNWGGDSRECGPTQARERRELVKIFEMYGCRVAGLAWYLFNHHSPKKDSKGKLVFDLDIPHRQFVSIDRKPSSFAKHFNAILKDPLFKEFSGEMWPKVQERLLFFYKGLLSTGPRNHSEIDASGIEFPQAAENG